MQKYSTQATLKKGKIAELEKVAPPSIQGPLLKTGQLLH